EQAASFVAQAMERFRRIDVLINNAGIIQVGPLDSMGVQDFREAMDINYFGMVYTTLAALPHLRGHGRIVNICSIGGAVAIPHLLPYVGSKHAAVGFSEGLTVEAMRLMHGIAPGLFDRVAALVNRLLPDPGDAGAGDFAEPGWLHRPAVASGPWTRLGDEAARKNREVPWAPPR